MYQRQLRPSMGAISRPFARDLAGLPNCASRSFHLSCRLEDASNNPPPAPGSASPRGLRRIRSNTAMKSISLLERRFNPSTLEPPPTEGDAAVPASAMRKIPPTRSPDPTRTMRRSAVPQGTMVRAPAKIRITRNGTDSKSTGRAGAGPKTNRPGNQPSTGAPRRREKGAVASERENQDVRVEDTLSDGMVQHLLRLQRKEWDRVPYEPKYAHGSKAATDLVAAGKKLFEGEKPAKKKWTRLDRAIGIVGMHGA